MAAAESEKLKKDVWYENNVSNNNELFLFPAWLDHSVKRNSKATKDRISLAFNVFVKNGVVWREEQQGEYGASSDAPDYGPRGCQKGLTHSRYMYGKQRILYPLKRIGERGEGKWERIS